MSKITVGTPVTSPLVPGSDDTNTWPTHIAKYGQGGFELVADTAGRDGISDERKQEKVVLVLDKGDGTPALYADVGDTWKLISLMSGIRVVDQKGKGTDGVNSLKFANGNVTTDSDGNSVVTFTGSGGSISITDSFDETVDDITNLHIKNMSLIKKDKDSGKVTLEIETGIEITGNDGQNIDGVKQLEFPQGTTSHDDDTGSTKVEFDLDFKGLTVSDYQGKETEKVKSFTFERAKVKVDKKTGRAIVTTMTGVDVGVSGKVFNGIERINFNDCTSALVHDDGSLYITPQIQFTDRQQVKSDEGGTADSYQAFSNRLNAYPPLRMSDDLEDPKGDTVRLDIDPNAFEHLHAEAFLGYVAYPTSFVQGSADENSVTGFLWPDNHVYKPRQGIVVNESKKSFTLKKMSDMVEDYLYVAFKVNVGEGAQKDGRVSIYLVDANNPDTTLTAVDGKDMSKSLDLKQGAIPGDFYVDGVIGITQDTEVALKMTSSAGDLTVSGKSAGMTGLIIQQLTEKEATSPALQQWGSDTGLYPLITSYPVIGEFLTMPDKEYLKRAGLTDAQTHAKDEIYNLVDGWNIYATGTYVTKWQDDYLFIDNTPWGYVGAVVDSVRTKFIASDGQKAVVRAKVRPYQPDLWLVAVEWTGDEDNPTYPICTDLGAKGAITYNTGWSQVEAASVTAKSDGSVVDVAHEFTIPFTANNIAFILVPKNKGSVTNIGPGMQLGFKDFSVSSKSDDKIHFKVQHASGDGQTYKSVIGIESSVGGDVTGMPIGTTPWPITPYIKGLEIYQDGNAPITFDGNGAGLRFHKAGAVSVDFLSMFQVKIKVKALSYVNNGQGGIRFYAELFDKDFKSKGVIKQSKRYIWLPSNHGAVEPEISFPTTVEEGDVLRFYAVADKDDVVEVSYMPGVSGDKNLVFMANATYLSKSRDVSLDVNPLNVVNPAPAPSTIDFSQFDDVYTTSTTVTKVVKNKSKAKIPVVVPDGAKLVVVSAIKEEGDKQSSVTDFNYSYENGVLDVSFGETATVRLVLNILE